jgi:hypothetical protein
MDVEFRQRATPRDDPINSRAGFYQPGQRLLTGDDHAAAARLA